MREVRPRPGAFLLLLSFLPSCAPMAENQDGAQYTGPIIDMHMHASAYYLETTPDGEPLPFDCYPAPCDGVVTAARDEADALRMTLESMDRYNIVLGFLTGDTFPRLEEWNAAAPGRFIRSPEIGPPGVPSLDELREEFTAGRLEGMGEIETQYDGYAPNDPAVAPYFALAAQRNVPVLVHTAGIGAPTPDFRVAKGDPRLLEEVLAAQPGLRLSVENCGFPFAAPMIAMLYQYPGLYCDVSTITWIIDHQAFVDYLERLIRAGVGRRIMFGSDQMLLPETIGMAVDAIQSAEFLTLEQTADIFYDNAARFLGLSNEEMATHHSR